MCIYRYTYIHTVYIQSYIRNIFLNPLTLGMQQNSFTIK